MARDRRARITLVDGPDHGLTFGVEGDPPRTWRTPGVVAWQATGTADLSAALPTHLYEMVMETRTGTLVYVWRGHDA